MRRGKLVYVAVATAVLVAVPLVGSAFGGARPIADHLRDHGFNEFQIDAVVANGWNIDGLTQMYGFGDDPLGPPGVSEEEAAGTVPIAIGVEYVRFTDRNFLPPPVDRPTVIDDTLLIPFGEGPLEKDRLYVWFWAEMKGEIEYDQAGVGINIAWPSYVKGADRWESVFKGDSWIGASHIPVFFNDPNAQDPLAFTADLFSVDGSSLNSYQGPGGLAWVGGSLAGIYVPADALMGDGSAEIEEYGYAADFTLNPGSQFDPNAPRKVTVYPANFTADGRQGGLEPLVRQGRFPLNVGLTPYADITNARLIRDGNDDLWAALTFLKPWPLDNPTAYFLDEFFSFGVGAQISYNDMLGPVIINEFHDGAHNLYGSGPAGEIVPTGMLVMGDGSLRVKLEYKFSELAAETDTVTLGTFGAFWKDEVTTERQAVDRDFEITVADIPQEDPFGTDQIDLTAFFDLVNDEQLIDPGEATTPEDEGTPGDEATPEGSTTETVPTTTEEPTTTTTLAATTATTETTTVTRDRADDTCWWCWGAIALFLAVLLCVLYIWLKTYDWWTCWLPWFIVIFVWAPFLLAGMWWWRPVWWWVPLLAWFPIVGGYTWYWARHRSWWRPWHLYAVGGYLVALAIGMLVVGSPEWGLLFPLFWVPWVGFYLWFRGRRQPWFQPWMWLFFGGYVAWIFIWVIALTPWWSWWLPVLFFPILGWWFVTHGYGWRQIFGPKWCWVLPFTFLPFLAWWIPLWGPWWCFVILAFLALTLLCVAFNHLREEEWWTWWIFWLLIIWVGIPFLLAGLWFFGPNWWWLPLLGWFAVIPWYAYFWAQKRSWWQPRYWYAVGGYLAVAAILMVAVGSPTWGLLFPVFWLVPVAFYLWYRPRRQPWFQPWMWGLFGAYIVWMFIWVIWLTPFWGWWFPVFFIPFFGWWGITHGYSRRMWTRKSCLVIPLGLLPWMGYMLAIYCIPEYYSGL